MFPFGLNALDGTSGLVEDQQAQGAFHHFQDVGGDLMFYFLSFRTLIASLMMVLSIIFQGRF